MVLRNRLSWPKRGFDGSTLRGMTKWGGGGGGGGGNEIPTPPQNEITLDLSPAAMDSLLKSRNARHDGLLENTLPGGIYESKLSFLNYPLYG